MQQWWTADYIYIYIYVGYICCMSHNFVYETNNKTLVCLYGSRDVAYSLSK